MGILRYCSQFSSHSSKSSDIRHCSSRYHSCPREVLRSGWKRKPIKHEIWRWVHLINNKYLKSVIDFNSSWYFSPGFDSFALCFFDTQKSCNTQIWFFHEDNSCTGSFFSTFFALNCFVVFRLWRKPGLICPCCKESCTEDHVIVCDTSFDFIEIYVLWHIRV